MRLLRSRRPGTLLWSQRRSERARTLVLSCMWLWSIRASRCVSGWIVAPRATLHTRTSPSSFRTCTTSHEVHRTRRYLSVVAPSSSAMEGEDDNGAPLVTTRTKNLVIVIAGPTGVGKSDVAARLCTKHRGVVVSADSVQAYEGVQIGANKPTPEELQTTPHLLVDIVNSDETYNAAQWRRDAIYTISNLLLQRQTPVEAASSDGASSDSAEDTEEDGTKFQVRRQRIQRSIHQGRLKMDVVDMSVPVLPVVVGGTMMYLQWLVHGRPDAVRPSPEALNKAKEDLANFQSMEEGGWEKAVTHVSSLGSIFATRAQKLFGRDWYRLRRTMEVAYTVLAAQSNNDDDDNDNNGKITEQMIQTLYSGQREGGLQSLGYDVRCFFLCPDDRMTHTGLVDRRCEEMLVKGLFQETTDLYLAEMLPDMAAKAIGYRQTLDYLLREDFKEGDQDAFDAFMNDFTTATRRYAKKQMAWFRKEDQFVFVPVSLIDSKLSRVQTSADAIEKMCQMTRDEYERELVASCDKEQDLPSSARTKLVNLEQGKKMKFYQFKRHILKPGAPEYDVILQQADECSRRIRKKRSKTVENLSSN